MNTLLRYDITTNPFPLQASAATGNPSIAQVTIVASNPTPANPVTLEGLAITFPVGTAATDLTSQSTGIGPVPPVGWTLKETQTSSASVTYIFEVSTGQGQVGSTGLSFIFNNIELNREPGTAVIEVMEGSGGCKSPNCPTKDLQLTKFPNGWGEVTYWTNPSPPIIPYNGGVTLNWSGPAGATYTIEYYTPQTGVMNIPATGQPALANEGQYPASNDPPLQLTTDTTFYLYVVETINGQTYSAQQQITATVMMQPPQIIAFGVSPTGFSPPETPVTLSWQAAFVSELRIDDVGSFTGAEATQGTAQVTRNAPGLFLAEGYGLVGYSGPPANAHTCFGNAVSSVPITMNAPPSTDITTTRWTLTIDGDRSIFDLNVDAASTGADDWITFRIWLALKPGVQVADLGTSGPNASDDDLKNASYSTSLPETDIYNYASYYQPTDPHPHDPSYEQVSYPLPVGATWGVQFADGSKVLVWFEGMQGADFQPPLVNFVWFEF